MCMNFADKLKSLRRTRGLTQMQLSEQTNISLGVIAMIEAGRRVPSKEAAKRLSVFFQVPLDTFIIESDNETTVVPGLDMHAILEIADIVREYMAVNGYDLTPEQREALVAHFYQQNLHDAGAIKQQLSVMAVLQSFPKKGK